jgi:hypothetical protein
MAQTTVPPQPPPYGVAPPPSQLPTANQFSSNEVIDAERGAKRREVTDFFAISATDSSQCRSFGTGSSPSGSSCLLASDRVKDSASIRSGGECRRSGDEPRNSDSSRDLIPPDHAGGSSGVNLQLALVSVYWDAVARWAQPGVLV